jgi:hypothetical protein
MLNRLTARQLKFAKLVADGMSELQAVLEAGYSPASKRQSLTKLRDNQRITEQIEFYRSGGNISDKPIADSDDRQRLWTKIMNDPSFSGNIRLEASKLLGKAQGDFVVSQKIEHSNSNPIVLLPKASPKEWEEYWENQNE